MNYEAMAVTVSDLNSYIKEVSDIVTMKNGKTYVYSTLEDLGVIK